MMKKIFLLASLILGANFVSAGSFDEVIRLHKSSFTTSNDSNKHIKTLPGDIFVGVVVSSYMPNGSIAIYDSSATATNQIGVVSAYSVSQTPFSVEYNVRLSSGLTYTTSGNTVGFTILYKKLRTP